MTYAVTTKFGGGVSGDTDRRITVEAATYDRAASAALEILCPRQDVLGRLLRGPMVPRRTTGTPGKSGWYQGYACTGDGLNSSGPAFHVS